MMRSLILLSLLAPSAAGNVTAATGAAAGSCLTSAKEKGMLAGNDLLDAAVYSFAASKRCVSQGQEVKCEVDVSEAMHSTLSLINNVLKLLNDCDLLHTYNKDCGIAASELVETVAGLAAGVGRTIQHCPQGPPDDPNDSTFPVEYVAKCTVYVKDAATSIFKAISAIMAITACDADSAKCKGTKAQNALLVAQVLAGLGSYLSGSVGYCAKVVSDLTGVESKINSKAALCAEGVNDVVKFSAMLARDGIDLSKKCYDTKPARLYKETQGVAFEASASPNLLLMACLPVTAILSFLGGRMASKHRSAATRTVSILGSLE